MNLSYDACVILITRGRWLQWKVGTESVPAKRSHLRLLPTRVSIILSKTQQPTLYDWWRTALKNLFNSVSLVYRHSLPAHLFCFFVFLFFYFLWRDSMYAHAGNDRIHPKISFPLGTSFILFFSLFFFFCCLLFFCYFFFRLCPAWTLSTFPRWHLLIDQGRASAAAGSHSSKPPSSE